MKLEIDGGNARSEVYALLSQARVRFGLALHATISPSQIGSSGAIAGHDIFRATYDALSSCKWGDSLPSLSEIDEMENNDTVLPYPVMIALAYFLDSQQTVCLQAWHFQTGDSTIDQSVIPWPKTILWGLPAKMRFFYDLFESYDGQPIEHPLLSSNRTRAAQLLIVGNHLLERELKKIGRPNLDSLAKVKNKNILY